MSAQDFPRTTDLPHASHHAHDHAHAAPESTGLGTPLAWPALMRLAVVAPLVGLLWALVYWANGSGAPW